METIPKKECTKIGFIRKTHGVHGEVALEFEPQFEFSVEAAKLFFIELEGLLVPFFVSENGMRFKSGKTALVTFDWVESENYARRLVGQDVYLFQNEIIDADQDETSSPYLDYLLKDKTLGEIGIISEMEDYSGNIVLTVSYNGKPVLVPFNEDFLISVDKKQKILTLDLPDGLIET
jgi:16S rRNA processing protein RimM